MQVNKDAAMHLRTAFFAMTALVFTSLGRAQNQPAVSWLTPAIAGAGSVIDTPAAAYRPDASRTYQAVFSIDHAASDAKQANPSLEKIAKSVNLFLLAGVPLDQLKVVAVVSADALPLALDNVHYEAKYGIPNPNARLLSKLKAAGVDVVVDAQDMAQEKISANALIAGVGAAFSATSTIITLQNAGYAFMPL